MILTQETLHPRSFFGETYHWFACSVDGCNQRYDMGNGYYVNERRRNRRRHQQTTVCRLWAFSLSGQARLSDGGHSGALRK
jgi:hypothetical protein